MNLKDALQRTQSPQVHVAYDKVAELIGDDLADELCLSEPTAMSQKRTKERNLFKAMKAKGKILTNNIAAFPREKLLDAIRQAEQKHQEAPVNKFQKTSDN